MWIVTVTYEEDSRDPGRVRAVSSARIDDTMMACTRGAAIAEAAMEAYSWISVDPRAHGASTP